MQFVKYELIVTDIDYLSVCCTSEADLLFVNLQKTDLNYNKSIS